MSGYLRVVSSGAANVASSVRAAGASVAASIAELDDAGRSQVNWAGFDKLEFEGGVFRRILLLGYRSGFQVWDVEDGDDVRQLVARHDGTVSFLQMQKRPTASKISEDPFADARPLLLIAIDQSFSAGDNNIRGLGTPLNGSVGNQELDNDNLLPTSVSVYSLRKQSYVDTLRFRSPVYSIRCSPRVVAISLAAQIHCFNAVTLTKEYTVGTCLVHPVSRCSGAIGCGPLALASRWLAYNGTPVDISSTDRVSPQHLDPATGLPPFPSNGSLMVHYAKESSKQLAAGIVTLGDMGYKKLSKYYSEFVPDNSASVKRGIPNLKPNNTINGDLSDSEDLGVVIVRDIVSKSVVVQFRAHDSPISALAFDPSETLLVTASIHGHSINVFHIMPSTGSSSGSDATTGTCVHLYRLQRGFTNAVIQDLSFSDDSRWIMVSSSRGTSHLFSLSHGLDLIASLAVQWPHTSCPSNVNHQSLSPLGSPITLSVVSRIKNGSNGWKGAVSGAAAAATGRVSPLSGAIASAFHNCKGSSRSNRFPDTSSLWTKNYLLVFSPSGCIIQYVLRHSISEDSGIGLSGLGTLPNGSLQESDSRLVVEALQKWDVCHKWSRRDLGDNIDVYGEHKSEESTKVLQKGTKKATTVYPADTDADMKVKPTAEEINHMYISEAELQTHSADLLWVKSKAHFQVMVDENIVNGSCALDGEVEIERIPTRTVGVRIKDPIPALDYLQTPRLEQSRATSSGMRQKSGVLEDGKNLSGSSCSSLDSTSRSDTVAKLPNGFSGNFGGGFGPLDEAKDGFVNNNVNSPNINTQLEFVNNTESLDMVAQLEHVK